jgi:YesN/AraC family two-component response regulator
LFSDTTRINLDWVRWFINGFLVVILSAVTVYLIMSLSPAYFDWCVLGSGVFIAIYVLMTTFKGLTQVTLWQAHPEMTREILETETGKAGQIQQQSNEDKSIAGHRIESADARINEIATRILYMMEDEKIYREPELTLKNLAEKLQVPSYQVSQAINEGIKKSFYELVNRYRVEEAKKLLLDARSRNYTILSIGFEAGFNSKTTFNTVFKKFTGFTPTEFRDKGVPGLSIA